MGLIKKVLSLVGLGPRKKTWLEQKVESELVEYPWIKKLLANPHFQEINIYKIPTGHHPKYGLKAQFYDAKAFSDMVNQFEGKIPITDIIAKRITDIDTLPITFTYEIDAERFAKRHFGPKYVFINPEYQ